jgi:hypothetical protein
MPAKPSSTAASTKPAPAGKPEAKILFQKFFKSIGPRTYAAQIKEAGNGNHYLVLVEGKRDESTGELKKSKVFVFSEDFGLFFRMLHETAQYLKAHPVPEEVKLRRQRYWAKKEKEAKEAPPPPPPIPATRQVVGTRSVGGRPVVAAKASAKPLATAKAVTRRPQRRK